MRAMMCIVNILWSPDEVAQAAEKKRGLVAGDVVTPLPVGLPHEHAPRLRHGHSAVPGMLTRNLRSHQVP